MVLRYTAMGRLTAAFLAALAIPATGQSGIECEVSDLDEYDFMHSPMHGFLIYWTRPTTQISFMVEAEAEEWTALGFSADGEMVGSDAVIYLPELEEVSEHFLGSQSVTDIFAVPDAEDELTDTEFSQSDGDTIFSFTRNITPDDPQKLTIPNIPGSPVYLIWAEGMDNGFGYHGQDNRGAFLVDLFCGTTAGSDTDDMDTTSALETPAPSEIDADDNMETPAPSAMGTMEGTMEGTMGSTSAETSTSSTTPPTPVPTTPVPTTPVPTTPVPTTASSSAVPATLAPGTATPAPSVSPAPVTPSITMPPGGFIAAGTVTPVATVSPVATTVAPVATTVAPVATTVAPVASSSPSPIAAGPTDAPIPSSLGNIFGSDAPVASSGTTAPAAAGPTIPLPAGQTPAPSSGARAIGDVGITPSPADGATGSVGAAARGVGGGVTGAAVASAVAAVCLGLFWATSL